MLGKKAALFLAFTVLGTQLASAQPNETAPAAIITPGAAPDYARADHWLCRPENLGACDTDLDATVVKANGKLSRKRWKRSTKTPRIDCFYLYPTASLDPGSNSDLIPGVQPGEEIPTVRRQFARFANVCRLFAPLYRSTTVTAMIGAVSPGDRDMAYHDIKKAWDFYLANDNDGRGVVLIGHSQGSAMLRKLIKQEIDSKPAQDRIVSALLIGMDIAVPPGEDVGGDFKSMPLCRDESQIGCVVTYNSFRIDEPPSEKSFLGAKRKDGLLNACNNPAALQGGSATLDAYLETEWKVGAGAPSAQAPWTDPEKPIETPYVQVPGLISGECMSDLHGDYLAITIHTDRDDARVDDIKGDVEPAGERLSEWGLHIIDIELALGDLVRLVEKQSDNWIESQ